MSRIRDAEDINKNMLFLVKFSGSRINPETRRNIAHRFNLELWSYVPHNTYIVACTASEAIEIAATPGTYLNVFVNN